MQHQVEGSSSWDACRDATAVQDQDKDEERTAFLPSDDQRQHTTELWQEEASTLTSSSTSTRMRRSISTTTRRRVCRSRCCRVMARLLLRRFSFLILICLLLLACTFIVPNNNNSIHTYHYAERFAGDDEPLKLNMRVDVYPEQEIIMDDLVGTGKSCTHKGGRWHCHHCTRTNTNTSNAGRHSPLLCHKLKRRGKCRPFRRDNWDQIPRSVSQYDPANAEEMEFRTLSSRIILTRSYYHSQPQCTVSSCFDLNKCNNSTFTIFVNTTGPHALVDYAVRHLSSRVGGDTTTLAVQRVNDYNDACLSVTFRDTYRSQEAMKAAQHWKTTQGRNNLIYDMSDFGFSDTKGLGYDSPISLFHVGYAAVASVSLPSAMLRAGYDLVLPLRRKWGRPTATVDIHRPRKWLMTFRGMVKERPIAYYQHRWLAAEYWEEAEDVLVDVQCAHSTLWGIMGIKVYKEYDDPSPTAYADLIWNSTFGFAPGGSGVGSHRFGEILSTGGIPVVTHDLVLPLAPEVDWTRCAVRVSEARIVDLPALLRAMSPREVRRRQVHCWRLLQTVLGDADSEMQEINVSFCEA